MGRTGQLARRTRWAAAAIAVPLLIGAQASASTTSTTYYASPTGGTSAPCTQASPCRLDHAVSAAHAGDVVIVLPGTYSVSYGVSSNRAITLEGQPGQPRPSLVGSANLDSDTLTLSGGATVSDLEITTTGSQGNHQRAALDITGGVAQNLVLDAGSADSQGEALRIGDASAGTVVRTVLATSEAPGGSVIRFDDGSQAGNTSVYNLTAVGTSATSSTISGDVDQGSALIKDSILIGSPQTAASEDSSDHPIQIQSSAVQPDGQHDYLDGGGNISAAPVFVDAGAGNFREAAGSPTVDAGAPDPALSPTDLDGNPRVQGAEPDMGAYEFVPAAAETTTTTTSITTTSTQPTQPQPVFGTSVVVQPVSGTVLVAAPHSHTFEHLSAGMLIPVGSMIDTTQGTVALTSAINRKGIVRTGDFHGGRFVVDQSGKRSNRTRLRLLGGSFAACRSHHRTHRLTHGAMARIASHPKHHPHVVRSLWGSDNGGKFTTVGRNASAAVRGTVWLTQDLCGGTLVKVFKGHVVVRPHHHRAITLGPGQSYFAHVARTRS